MTTKRDTRKVFTLRVEMDNDAFENEPRGELARVVSGVALEVAASLADLVGSGSVRDANGNTVGGWIIAEHPVARTRRGGR